MNKWRPGALFILVCMLASCVHMPSPVASPPAALAPAGLPGSPVPGFPVQLVTPRLIPLSGPVGGSSAEVSGMAWYQDWLVLLPQYPERFRTGPEDGALFAIPKTELLAYIDHKRQDPIQPIPVPFFAPGLRQALKGYEGFEGIAIQDDRLFLTAETKPGLKMLGILLSGTISAGLKEIRVDASSYAEIPPQAGLPNMTDEALLVTGSSILTFYEANGSQVNPAHEAHRYRLDLQPDGEIPLPNLEYRLTDATSPDTEGKFWVINYFFPGDTSLWPRQDPLLADPQSTPSPDQPIERLVEMEYTSGRISFTGAPILQLQLAEDGEARNWEAIARLDSAGFLLATDKYPETLFAFVPLP